jgi:hypothetical protein
MSFWAFFTKMLKIGKWTFRDSLILLYILCFICLVHILVYLRLIVCPYVIFCSFLHFLCQKMSNMRFLQKMAFLVFFGVFETFLNFSFLGFYLCVFFCVLYRLIAALGTFFQWTLLCRKSKNQIWA